jgi:hypothetical protein
MLTDEQKNDARSAFHALETAISEGWPALAGHIVAIDSLENAIRSGDTRSVLRMTRDAVAFTRLIDTSD